MKRSELPRIPYSLEKRMLTLVSLALGFLISLLVASNLYAMSYANQKIAASNLRTMDYTISQIENNLGDIDSVMQGLVAASPDYISLFSGTDPLTAHLASQALIEQLREVSRFSRMADAVLVYSYKSDSYRDHFDSSFSYDQKQHIRRWMREVVSWNRFSYSDGWVARNINGVYYLMRFYGGRGTYLIALSTFDSLGDIAFYSDQKIDVAFTTRSGSQIFGQVTNLEAASLVGSADYLIGGSPPRMLLGRDIPETNTRIYLMIPSGGFWKGLPPLQTLLLMLSLASILLIPLALLWVRRSITTPIRDYKDTIARIRAGDLDARTPESDIQEFQEVSETFNDMMKQINDLKIEAYEAALDIQQAQLQYLQLQIRPHFYLNYLKGLYAVAQQGDSAKIQRMILTLSDHLRYMFRDQMEQVSLAQELKYIRNYMDIQQLYAANPSVCHIEVLDSLLDIQIPPMILSTFVENSINHRGEGQPVIWIRAERLGQDDEQFLVLTVQDNGRGFSDKVLKEINTIDDERKIYVEGHVGIRNIRQRLRMIYGRDDILAFYNSTAGPVAEVYIPMAKEEQHAEIDCADC